MVSIEVIRHFGNTFINSAGFSSSWWVRILSIDDQTLNKAREFISKKEEASEEQELSPEELLQIDIKAFNDEPVLETSAIARAKRYQERGAAWAMLHRVYCERVGRDVYFMDYSFKGEERDECIEGNPVVPKCPFAQMRDGQEPCKQYNRYPFGRNKTVSIDTSKIKKND
jgi:hypothetical protein